MLKLEIHKETKKKKKTKGNRKVWVSTRSVQSSSVADVCVVIHTAITVQTVV